MEKKVLKILILVVCIIGIAGIFLPYESSIGEYRESLKENPNMINMKEVNLKNSDVVDISLVENFKIYNYAIRCQYSDEIYDDALFNIVPTITLVVAIVLIGLFILLDKKILVIISNFIVLGSSLLLNYSKTSREIIPSSEYTYGISYYIYYAVFLVILVTTIYMLIIDKKKNSEE